VLANGLDLSLQAGVLGEQTLTTLVNLGPIPFELGNVNDFRDIGLRPALFIPLALRQRRLDERQLPPDLRSLVIGRGLLLGDFRGDELRLLQQPYHRAPHLTFHRLRGHRSRDK